MDYKLLTLDHFTDGVRLSFFTSQIKSPVNVQKNRRLYLAFRITCVNLSQAPGGELWAFHGSHATLLISIVYFSRWSPRLPPRAICMFPEGPRESKPPFVCQEQNHSGCASRSLWSLFLIYLLAGASPSASTSGVLLLRPHLSPQPYRYNTGPRSATPHSIVYY